MDWENVKLPKEKRPKRLTCGELADLDHWKLIAASKILRKSVASTTQTAIYTYLGKNWADHEARIKAEALALGISPEEMFERLINGDEDGD